MYLVFRYVVSFLFVVTAVQAEFATFDLNLSGLSSLSEMGKKLNKLSDLNFSTLEEDNESSIRPYLNESTKALEKKYPWLYDEMEKLLMNEENMEAYVLESAYFKILDDLNGDGIEEVYLHSQARCGASICNYRVYQIDVKGKKLKEIFDSYTDAEPTVIGKVDSSGWKTISLMQCWGATSCQCYRFAFDSKSHYYSLVDEIKCSEEDKGSE